MTSVDPLMFFVQCCKSSRFCHLLHDKNSAIFIRLYSCAITMHPPPIPHGFKRPRSKIHIFSRLEIMKLKIFKAKNLDITEHLFHFLKFLRKMSLNEQLCHGFTRPTLLRVHSTNFATGLLDQLCHGFTRPTLPTKNPERRVSSLGNP